MGNEKIVHAVDGEERDAAYKRSTKDAPETIGGAVAQAPSGEVTTFQEFLRAAKELGTLPGASHPEGSGQQGSSYQRGDSPCSHRSGSDSSTSSTRPTLIEAAHARVKDCL